VGGAACCGKSGCSVTSVGLQILGSNFHLITADSRSGGLACSLGGSSACTVKFTNTYYAWCCACCMQRRGPSLTVERRENVSATRSTRPNRDTDSRGTNCCWSRSAVNARHQVLPRLCKARSKHRLYCFGWTMSHTDTRGGLPRLERI
jgi:hypothetical protein